MSVNFKQGKVKREELDLPPLHFVAMDNWVEVIGEKAFLSWLKFYTWCDRSETSDEVNKWDQATIPDSFTKLIKKLGVGRETFYNQIIRPLWNVGLIDIEEWEKSDNKGQKPMNIIVYKYPQNKYELATKPLELVRDYDKDYHSNARVNGKKGGRPKSKNAPVPSENRGYSETEQGVFRNRTGPRSEIEHNNIFNNYYNNFNFLYKSFNILYNIINSSSSSAVENPNTEIREEEENKINKTLTFISEYLKYESELLLDIKKHMIKNKIYYIDRSVMIDQHEYMVNHNKIDPIINWGYCFVNACKNKMISKNKKTTRPKRQEKEEHIHIPFYNWLES